jgi:RimJ/RimL family protein N-acetyltransferase
MIFTKINIQTRQGKEMETIETKRLVLRELKTDDFNDFWELSKNWKKAPGPDFDKFPIDENGVKGFFNYCLKNNANGRYIYLRSEKKVIGLIALNGLNENGQMDMGHIIHSDYQNDDIDREALSVMIDYVFRTTEAKAIITNNDPDERQNAPLYGLGFIDRNKNGGQLIIEKNNWKNK